MRKSLRVLPFVNGAHWWGIRHSPSLAIITAVAEGVCDGGRAAAGVAEAGGRRPEDRVERRGEHVRHLAAPAGELPVRGVHRGAGPAAGPVPPAHPTGSPPRPPRPRPQERRSAPPPTRSLGTTDRTRAFPRPNNCESAGSGGGEPARWGGRGSRRADNLMRLGGSLALPNNPRSS